MVECGKCKHWTLVPGEKLSEEFIEREPVGRCDVDIPAYAEVTRGACMDNRVFSQFRVPTELEWPSCSHFEEVIK